MDQLSTGDSSSDSNSSSSSSSDDSSSSSDSEDERTSQRNSTPASHSMPIINTSTETNSRHQESGGGLMNTLSEYSLHFFSVPEVAYLGFERLIFTLKVEVAPKSNLSLAESANW